MTKQLLKCVAKYHIVAHCTKFILLLVSTRVQSPHPCAWRPVNMPAATLNGLIQRAVGNLRQLSFSITRRVPVQRAAAVERDEIPYP